MRIARRAAGGKQAGYKPGLLLRRQVAGIVHRGGTRRASIARGVHRKHVESRAGKVRHPTIVLIRNVECHLRRSTRAVHEENNAVFATGRARYGRWLSDLPDVDLREL